MKMQMQKGFTLMEVMVVVVIIGILMTVAIPSYRDHVINGKITEATAGLAQGKIRMEQSFQDNRSYAALPCPPATGSFNFTCTNPSGDTNKFLIEAKGNLNSPVEGFKFTINEQNLKTTTSSAWNITNANCWMAKKGTSC